MDAEQAHPERREGARGERTEAARGAAALALLLLAIGALTWLARRAAAGGPRRGVEAQAVALVRVLRASALEVEESLERAEGNLAGRLAATARRADVELEASREPAQERLTRIAREERVGRVFLLDAQGEVLAVVRHPEPLPGTGGDAMWREGAQQAEVDSALAAIRESAPSAGEVRIEGLRTGVGVRERFGVVYGRPGGGHLLLRADADELADLRRRFGLDAVLERIANVPGVLSARLLDAEGRVVLGGPDVPAEAAGADAPADAPTAPVRAPLGSDRPPAELPAPDEERTVSTDSSLTSLAGFRRRDGDRYAVSVSVSTADSDAQVARLQSAILWGGLATAAAVVGGAVLLGAMGRRHRRVRERLEARREEDRRLADMGALASLVTHEISNPLHSVRLALRLLDRDGLPPDQLSLLDTLEAESARMSETMESFLALARRAPTALEAAGPDLLRRVEARVAALARAKAVRIRTVVEPEGPPASGNAALLEQALASLVRNAVQASPERGEVEVRWAPDERGVRISVTDQGPGFPEGDPAQWFRLGRDSATGGHGVGLALARRFVEAEGGSIELADRPGGGACARVLLKASSRHRS